MRSIKISIPSGKAKLTLWENTEDAESFLIKGIKSGKPYVSAYGIKHYLTSEEIEYLNSIKNIINNIKE